MKQLFATISLEANKGSRGETTKCQSYVLSSYEYNQINVTLENMKTAASILAAKFGFWYSM